METKLKTILLTICFTIAFPILIYLLLGVILGWWNAGASINESGIVFEWGVTQWLSTKQQ